MAFILMLTYAGTSHANTKNADSHLYSLEMSANLNPGDSIKYSAKTSTTLSKDKQTITLIGDAQFQYNSFKITADEITFDIKTQTLHAKNYVAFEDNGKAVKKGISGEFHLDRKL